MLLLLLLHQIPEFGDFLPQELYLVLVIIPDIRLDVSFYPGCFGRVLEGVHGLVVGEVGRGYA